eukprot:3617483-Amphidinium_carterae.1
MGKGPEQVPPEILSKEELERQLVESRRRLEELEAKQSRKRVRTSSSEFESSVPKSSKLGEIMVDRVTSSRGGAPVSDREKTSALHRKTYREKSDGDIATDSDGDLDVGFQNAPGFGMEASTLQTVAQQQPGRLAAITLHRMSEFVGAETGASAHNYPNRVLRPISYTYLITTFFARHPEALQNMRSAQELRTLTTILDTLSKGLVLQSLDMIAQRIKAIELSIKQGSWTQAKHLELVPDVEVMSSTREEMKLVQKEDRLERRLSSLGSRMTTWTPNETYYPPKGKGKGTWGKGKKKGKEKGAVAPS